MWYIYTRNTTSLLPLITVSLFSVFVNLLLFHRYSPGLNTGVSSVSLLQGIFQTQGSNPGLPHCRQILAEPQGKPKNTGVGSFSLLQQIFPSRGSNPGLPHCRRVLYHLSHQGSPRILEWVAYSFTKGTSWPRNQTRISCTAGGFFTSWATWERCVCVCVCVCLVMFDSLWLHGL